MKHVAIYSRISVDRAGKAEGVELQERWGREYAARVWPGIPVEAYTDNDLSAASGAHRPAYAALRAAIVAGDVAHLWAVEQSRLERREAAWFELAAELTGAGIDELHTQRDGVLRVGDEIAGIKAVLNAAEARKLRRRTRDRLDASAADGLPNGGRRYGYRRTVNDSGSKTLEIVEAEAAVIREAADLVLRGWSLARIVDHLDAQGARSARGGNLTPKAVRSMLLAPTTAGLRTHHGTILGPGQWQPILDEPTWQAVRAKLTAPRTIERADGSPYQVSGRHWAPRPTKRYLLTGGIARCGVCEAPLVGQLKKRASGPVPALICHPNRGGRACVAIMMEPVERHVVAQLWDELDRPEFLAAIVGDDQTERREALAADLAAQERKRAELAELWAGETLTAIEWQTARRAINQREQELLAELAAIPTQRLDAADLRGMRAAWDVLTLDERRELFGLFVEAVVIGRARPGVVGFDAGRIEIRWQV